MSDHETDLEAGPESGLGFVHRFVPARHPGFPPLLLLHGTGGDENDLLALGERLARGAALLSPRGKVLEGAQPRFFRRHGEAQWDLADFWARTTELADFIAAARTHYGLGKPVAVGFSNGANIGWSLLLHTPTTLSGAILIRPMLPFDPRPLPDLEGLPVLILAGMEDTLIPHEQPVLLAALLGEAGANATFEMVPGGHGLTAQDMTLAASWLRDHLAQR